MGDVASDVRSILFVSHNMAAIQQMCIRVILLATGGHGFEVLEESEMIEVKQGPYAGDADKTRFAGITAAQARFTG